MRSTHLERLRAPEAEASTVHGRIIFVIAPDSPATRSLVDAVSSIGDSVLVTSTLLFAQGVPRLAGNYLSGRDAPGGLRSLVDEQEFVAALRRLTDAPLEALLKRSRARRIVEWSPQHTDHPGLIESVYPDAVIFGAGDVDEYSADPAGWLSQFEASHPPPESAVPPAPESGGSDVAGAEPSTRSPFADGLISVFGAPRSGTTWLEQMLLAHPECAGTPELESRIFAAISDCWRNFERVDGRGVGACLSSAELACALRRFCDDVFSACRDHTRPEARWFVEKTPVHAWHLDEMRRVYPDGWFVHLVRDGRDVARSITQFDHGIDDLGAAARSWQDTVREVRRRASRLARLREVRYEDLTADPVRVVSELFEWAGLPVGDSVRAAVRRVAAIRVSRLGTAGPVGPGKWITDLDSRDLATVYANAGEGLVDFGYLDAAELAAWRRRREYRRVIRRRRLARWLPWRTGPQW